jgi:ATP adenylyltransferase
MDILWAGWRSAYISSLGEPAADCLFCALAGREDDEALIVERGDHAYTVLNRYPYVSGHLMIAPYRHAGLPDDLDGNEVADLWRLIGRARRAVDAAMAPQGYNLGANLGRVAGAGVPGHVHFHLVPRWAGDANFMTTVGATRVLPEDLGDTLAKLRAALEA